MRIAYLVSHPIQYQVPLLRAINLNEGIRLHTFFLSTFSARPHVDRGFGREVSWDTPLLSGYPHTTLPALFSHGQPGRLTPLTCRLVEVANPARFDALWVHGYTHPVMLRAITIAKRVGIKVFLRGESHHNSARRNRITRAARQVCLRYLFKSVDGFLSIGSLNKDYYISHGAPETKIFSVPYAVDNDAMQAAVAAARFDEQNLIERLAITRDRMVILCASKLHPRKRAKDLLDALINLKRRHRAQELPYVIFAGDGPLRRTLEAHAASNGLSSVRFVGFQSEPDMAALYALSDLLVLPSEHEPWGLVVNEAMNASLPVVVSDHVGCHPDLVRPGINGAVFTRADINQLTNAIEAFTLMSPEARRQMGSASRRIISTWDFGADIRGITQACTAIQGSTTNAHPDR